jgi:hypothetical protein
MGSEKGKYKEMMPKPRSSPSSKTADGMGQVVTKSPLASKAHNDVLHSVRTRDQELEKSGGNPDHRPRSRKG